MARPSVHLADDRLRVRLSGVDAVVAITGGFDVPYAAIRAVETGPPEWPRMLEVWGVGLRAPPFVVKGRIGRKALGPYDRFFWQDRETRRVLRLRLEGHPRLREVHLDVDGPDALAEAIRRRMGK